MLMVELGAIAFAAFILDLLIGDPPYRYHPIRIMGLCITHVEEGLRKRGWDGKAGGTILVLLMGAIVLSGYFFLNALFSRIHPWLSLSFNLYLCYSCLALGDLLNHIKPVVHALQTADLSLARKSVGLLVGRDVQVLDEQALGRAAVETMAENFIDGFFSPLFWYFAGGLSVFFSGIPIGIHPIHTAISLMLLFKTASTLDSMVGYKNRRYFYFGWAGAKLDDLMNFFPARLSVLFLFLGAWPTRLHPMNGIKIAFRDRLKHDSPNAAHAESFVAGALDIRLGGPTKYPDGIKNKPWLGDGTPEVDTFHIHKTAVLLRCSAWIAVLALLTPFLLSITW